MSSSVSFPCIPNEADVIEPLPAVSGHSVFGIPGGGCEDAVGRGGAGVDPCYSVAAWNEHSQTFFSRDGEIQAWLPE